MQADILIDGSVGGKEAQGKGLAWALTLRQVFVSTESIVNPGVSLPI